jgi:hypothetical protein
MKKYRVDGRRVASLKSSISVGVEDCVRWLKKNQDLRPAKSHSPPSAPCRDGWCIESRVSLGKKIHE